MNNQEIPMKTFQQMKIAPLPGGSGVWFDEAGSSYTRLHFFRQPNGQVALYVMDACCLGTGDAIVDEEIIDVDKNPELFNLYDWDEGILVFDEVQCFLDEFWIAGSVSEFDGNAPTTTEQA